MTLYEEIEKEFDEKFNALISFGESQTGVSERENLKSFLRSSLRKQAEEIIGEIPTDFRTGVKTPRHVSLVGLREHLRSKFLKTE